jgi:tripartite-type tricarboxylate transporter receptor subunit TctC
MHSLSKPSAGTLAAGAVGLVLLAAAPTHSAAQAFPTKPVSIVIPSPPGGLQDTLARATADELTRKWGQRVLVENRVGGNAIVAGNHVARSAPDGHTVFMTTVIQLSNDLIPNRSVPFDPTKDFTPVIALVEAGMVLVTSSQSQYKSLQELIASARTKPGALNYGSFGVGSLPHVDTEALSGLAGIKATHIPYRGGPETILAVQSGQIAFTITGVTPALPFIRQGRLRALAYGGLRRSSAMPDVPTFSESGLKGFTSGGWFGWLAPSKTPAAIVEKIAADTGAVISDPAFRDKHIIGVGLELVNLQTDAFARQLASDRETYKTRLKAIDLKQD